jgi:L-amino acid N-acyltransferase YncA
MKTFRFVAGEERHASAILAILNEAIIHSTALYDYVPREPSAMEAWFQSKKDGNYPVIVAEAPDGAVMGFASYGTFRHFPGYKYSVEHSVYVEKSCRGEGLGRKLMLELIASAQRQNYHTMIGVIDSGNAGSIGLHAELGFVHCARIREAGFKFGRWLDVDFYQLLLPTPDHPCES